MEILLFCTIIFQKKEQMMEPNINFFMWAQLSVPDPILMKWEKANRYEKKYN